MPRGVDTWSEVVQSLCEQSLRSGGKAGGIRVTEWRVPEEEELHKKNYWVYMRACYRGYCFFVGGMNDFSGSGREAYDTALRTLRNVGVQPEARMGDDEELRFIMQKIYALDVIDRAAKIRIARSVKEILRMVSEKTA